MRGNAFRGALLQGSDWRSHDFADKRVAVIASGQDAADVVPAIVRKARAVKVFQTEPCWVLPRLTKTRRLFRPDGKLAQRVARLHLRSSVRDPWLRRLLTPDDRFERPRFAESSSYYTALQAPNCKLFNWPVYAIVDHGVRSAEGVEHRVDCIVLPDPSVMDTRPDPSPARREQPST